MNYFKHFGVYGVCIKHNKILVIKKTLGNYKNRYDLPGGSNNENESIVTTLYREVLEETTYKVVKHSGGRIFDVFVEVEDARYRNVHHIFCLYNIEVEESSENLSENLKDGINDSSGTVWLDINNINLENSSPLLLHVLSELKNTVEEGKIYKKWPVLTSKK